LYWNEYFILLLVLAVLAASGVTDIDRVAVHIILNILKDDIVSQNSICDRYSTALKLNNKDLVNTVVVQTFQKITTPDSPLLYEIIQILIFHSYFPFLDLLYFYFS
jgi:hypothetical protein